MRIDQLTKGTEGDLARISARVTWEDCERPSQEIHLSVPSAFADDLSCNPDALLVNAFTPAMHHGEKRVQIEGKLCPHLRDGVETAVQILQRWYGKDGHPSIVIEATRGFEPALPRTPERSACFVSGGVDSLTNLLVNRRNFLQDHPSSFRDGLFVAGVGLRSHHAYGNPAEAIARDSPFLAELAEHEQLRLIPVATNFAQLKRHRDLFIAETGGAWLAAIAHALSGRTRRVSISSTYAIRDLFPYGTHPLLDPYYSSAAFSVHHQGCHLTRLEKVGIVAGHDVGLRCLRACHFLPADHKSGTLNCGRCDKCMRTMLALLIHGCFDRCPTYPVEVVTPEMIEQMEMVSSPQFLWELVEPLERIGRHDLAQSLSIRLKALRWRNRVEDLDARYLGSRLKTLYRRFGGGTPR